MQRDLRGLALFFAITLFFCLIQSSYDGIVKRNRDFDQYRWWYPIYTASKRMMGWPQ